MWDDSTPAPNEPLTDHMLSSAEAALGIQLPHDYIASLRIKNGGSTNGHYHKLPDQFIPQHLHRYVDHGYVSVYDLNGIGTSDYSITKSNYLIDEWGLPKPIVILSGDGHWWIVFDYRANSTTPPIVFLDSDSGDTLHVADNFTSFLASLVPHETLFDEEGNFLG